MLPPASASQPLVAAVTAALMIFIDVFLNQGLIAIFVGLWMLLGWLPFIAFAPRFRGRRRGKFINWGIYMAAVFAVFALNALQNKLAMQRGEHLAQAIKTYQQATGSYPDSLQHLVPRYIDEIPLAKYTLLDNQFYYRKNDDGLPYLLFTVLPPFEKAHYHFLLDTWQITD